MSDENKPAVPDAVIEDLNKFQPRNLKHVVCVERKSLPSLEDIEIEKKRIDFVTNVETFDKNQLKPTKTAEKVVLPDRETIEHERNNKTEASV